MRRYHVSLPVCLCLCLCFFFLITACKKNQDTTTPEIPIDNAAFVVSPEDAATYAGLLDLRHPEKTPYSDSLVRTAKFARRATRITSAATVKDRYNLPSMYIYNYKDGGFAIVAADKRAPSVLAYSASGTFDTTIVPEGVAFWIHNMKTQIENIRSVKDANAAIITNPNIGDVSTLAIKNLVVTTEDSVLPLTNSTWDQASGFNFYCPAMSCTQTPNGKAWVGCVAIAIGQIMFYHKFPATVPWTSMSATSWTPEAAQLLYNIGLQVDMDYGCDGSGADGESKTLPCLQAYGYTGSKKSFDVFDPYDNTAEDMRNEIKASRPFIISGGHAGSIAWVFKTYKDGHEWICDGYKYKKYSYLRQVPRPRGGYDWVPSVTYHTEVNMNWGWGGAYNGYFEYGQFGPQVAAVDRGRDDIEGTYNYKTVMYYNIHH